MKNNHLKQYINLFFLLFSSILFAQVTGTHYVGRPATYISADKTPTVGSLSVICDGEGRTGNPADGIGLNNCYWLKNLNPVTIKLNINTASRINAMSFYGPWGFNEWVKNVEVKFYNINTLLGTENLNLPAITGSSTTIQLSKIYNSVTRVEFKIVSDYGVNQFDRVSLGEIAFKDLIIDTPVISLTAANCSAAGTAKITNYNSAFTYQFSPSGPVVGAGGVISGMTAGTNYTVKAGYNSDLSSASSSFSIAAMLPTPSAPTVSVTSASCSTAGTARVSNYNSAYTYTFSPTGPSVGSGGVISGMTFGTNYTVTAKSGTCTSTASSSFSIAAMLSTPAVPSVSVTPASCSTAGTARVSNYNSAYTYTFSPTGPGVGSGGVISGMTVGTNYTVTAKNGSCTSAASSSFSIAAMLPTPAVPTLSVTASTAAVSNYNSAYTYTFSPAGPNIGVGGAISGMITGTVYTVTAKNGPCTSASSAPFGISATAACIPGIFLTQDADTSLYIVDHSTNPFTFTPIGSPAGFGYNATGYNPKDGFLYAMKKNPVAVLRINPTTGAVTDLGSVNGLPSTRYVSGEIDDQGNYYVLSYPNANGDERTLHKIDLTTLTSTPISLSEYISTFDFTYNINDGKLYGVHIINYGSNSSTPKSQLYSIDPATGGVNFIGEANNDGGVVGAMYGAAGHIYGVKNMGGLYKYNTTTGERTLISTSPFSNVENDGAHCVTSPFAFSADLYVTKNDGKTNYIPGTTNTYTIIAGNNGPFGVQGAAVSDPVPSGIPADHVSYTAVATGGATTGITGTQTGAMNDIVNLPVGGTIIYTVTVNIPASYTGELTNTVKLIPPADSTDPDMSNNTATDTDTTSVCLKPGDFSTAGIQTKMGITVQQKQSGWPENIPNGFITLESKTKGMVITRVQNQNTIADPKEGMLIYDIDSACVKLFNGITWNCIKRSCNN